jgi:AAA15 family ATPase/GTPase
MRLQEFQVHNYRSIIDSGAIKVEEITALIGPNEAGKSSILECLNSISFESHYQYFDLTQLNGTLKKYNDSELRPEEILIVRSKFELSQDDKQELKSILDGEKAGIPVTTEKEKSNSQEKNSI